MKIIALTMIGNENEIIESFIRYNFNFIDKMLIVSTCCIDNTLIIVRKLIKEGFNIELIEEPEIAFDQRYLDNKYIKKIANEEENDSFILMLDADEFLSGEDNPRKILEGLSLDCAYAVKWKNYAMCESDDQNEMFIPRRLHNVKKNFAGNLIEKVFFPSKLVLSKNIVVETGHHEICGENLKVVSLNTLWLAHFPSISKEQYLLRIYESSIKYITWRKRAFDEGYHIYRQIAEIESGKDVFSIANGYGLSDDTVIEIEEEPLNLSWCTSDSIKMKYPQLATVNVFSGVKKIGQLMAIKAYNLELDIEADQSKQTILIYGIGKGAEKLLNGIPENFVNIRAYIDSNSEKCFRMYKRRLVITPDYVRFFKYDKIIITSRIHYDEMLEALLSFGVEKDKISSAAYLFDLI